MTVTPRTITNGTFAGTTVTIKTGGDAYGTQAYLVDS